MNIVIFVSDMSGETLQLYLRYRLVTLLPLNFSCLFTFNALGDFCTTICGDRVAMLGDDVLDIRCVLRLSLLIDFIFLYAFCCCTMPFNSPFVCFIFFEQCTSNTTSDATPMPAVLCLAWPCVFVKFDLPRCDDFNDEFVFVGVNALFDFAMTDNNEVVFLWQVLVVLQCRSS